MKRTRADTSFDDAIHHMEMACIMNDTEYLRNEIRLFLKNYDVGSLNKEQLDQITKVTLEASMDGNIHCLECLHNMGIPFDRLCPVIAAYHGHKNVIVFCAEKGMDCTEAWNRYFSWLVMADPNGSANTNAGLMLASEWLSEYKNAHTTAICVKN